MSLELVEDLRAAGAEGLRLLEEELECQRGRTYIEAVLTIARGLIRSDARELAEGEALLATMAKYGHFRKRRASEVIEPRRSAAFVNLASHAYEWVDERGFRSRFLAAIGELGGRGKEAEAIVPGREKLGRNDPCPCGSGKKYKKCCGAEGQAPRGPAIGELLLGATCNEEFYALTFAEQVERLGEEAVRAHVKVLTDRRESRRQSDPYLKLAVLAREGRPIEHPPPWKRDLALELIEGPDHPAVDKAMIGSWLLLGFDLARKAMEMVPRVAEALRGRTLTIRGATDLALRLLDHAPELARPVASSAPGAEGDGRLSLVRALIGRELDEPDAGIAVELERAHAELVRTDGDRILIVNLEECLAGLTDPPPPPIDLDALLRDGPSEPAPEAVPAATPPATARAGSEGAAADVPRRTPVVSEALGARLEAVALEKRERERSSEKAVREAGAELESARGLVVELEQRLEAARARAARAKKALAQREAEARDQVLAPPIALVTDTLERAERRVVERLTAGTAPADAELEWPVVLATTGQASPGQASPGQASVVVLTLAAEATSDASDQELVDLARAVVAAVPGTTSNVLGRLAMVAPDGLDAQALAAALDGALSGLSWTARARLFPEVSPLRGEVAAELLAAARPVAGPTPVPAKAAPEHPPGVDLSTDSEVTTLKGPGDPLDGDENDARRSLRNSLRRLLRFGKVGASHTRIDNMFSGVPPHLRGVMKDAAHALISERVLRPKPTLNGLHISIEPGRVPEVERAIETGAIAWRKVREALGDTGP